ncbi:uncharacterized protein [Coffea arabica]|uniref:Cysteine proteinase inhibitor n=1 Tax=Coffea arabica TaxID=13443 RepID=A0A6P6W953_COFAR|nr:uncharacterized protein LOC113730561 [Coffea arabica]
MALRVALGRAKPWGLGYQLVLKCKLGFLGAIGSGMTGGFILDQNHLRRFPSSKQSCRHYFLPPPPPEETVHCLQFHCVIPVSNDRVSPFAQFAVKKHNEDQGGGDTVRFVRVVRASSRRVGMSIFYYITLEAVDELGDLNVYYAEVENSHLKNIKRLVEWQLVNESFSYRFQEIRYSKQYVGELQLQEAARRFSTLLLRKIQREDEDLDEAQKNKIKSVFRQNTISPSPMQILNLEKSLLNADICPKGALDLPTAASDVVVPVHDIKAYEQVYQYATFAVWTHNENEGDVIRLEEVLLASKFNNDDGLYYVLYLEALDRNEELNFYYVVVKVGQYRDELIKFHQINESLHNPLKEHWAKLIAGCVF